MVRARLAVLRPGLVAILGLVLLGSWTAPVAAAPNNCAGGTLDQMYRSDYTSFTSVKECKEYVKGGGILKRPAIGFELWMHFGEWCEVGPYPIDFPGGVTINAATATEVKLIDGTVGVYTYETSFVTDAAGNPPPTTGIMGGSVTLGGTMSVTTTFPGGASPITVTGAWECTKNAA